MRWPRRQPDPDHPVGSNAYLTTMWDSQTPPLLYAAATPDELLVYSPDVHTDRRGRTRATSTWHIPWTDITHWTRQHTEHPPPHTDYPADAITLTLNPRILGGPLLTILGSTDRWHDYLTDKDVPRK